MRNLNITVCFIPETQVSSEKSIKTLSSQWDGRSVGSPAPWRQGGVAILFSSSFVGEIGPWKRDLEGRVVSVLVSFGSFNCILISVYVPTNRFRAFCFFSFCSSVLFSL